MSPATLDRRIILSLVILVGIVVVGTAYLIPGILDTNETTFPEEEPAEEFAPPSEGIAQRPRRFEPQFSLERIGNPNTIIVKDGCDYRGFLLPKGETIRVDYMLTSLVDYPMNATLGIPYVTPSAFPEELPEGVEGRFEPSTMVLQPRESRVVTLVLMADEDAEVIMQRTAMDLLTKQLGDSGRSGGYGGQLYIAVGEGEGFPIDFYYSAHLVDNPGVMDIEQILSPFPRGEMALIRMDPGETVEARWRMRFDYSKDNPVELRPTVQVLPINRYDADRMPEGVTMEFSTTVPTIIRHEEFDIIIRISAKQGMLPTRIEAVVTPLGPMDPSLGCYEEPFHAFITIMIGEE